ncbi:hotdog fold thioesterase [Photorhabdus antumapuensis]|uniref:hotdog fold thioesterase n=1 Tax=Photorhabdus antumapuensis TaxID=2862867 RepID=UPI001CEDA41D|nr:beta-ketoacyl synthase N-terminal-like domain-containing protein [Photorhabdus antumapuensis]MCA6221637.1 beta-ketoacyl synthase [Photorhabdus antumapuensis]
MENIAIVGLGCLFPEADTIEKYWANLCLKNDSTTPLSAKEVGVDPAFYYHPVSGTVDKISYNRNGHVRDFHFDAKGYALPENEILTLDNLFKWTIYTAAEALNDSGYRDKQAVLKKTGLLIGNIGMPTHSGKRLMSPFYHRLLTPYIQQLIGRPDFSFDQFWPEEVHSDLNLITGGHNATIAAQALGLQGPSYALDAACSSALYAIKMAADYLACGKAEMMLVGAVCHADHIYVNQGFNILRAFPDGGASVPFERTSEGLKAGEGVGIVAIKRYADAIRDNDKIYGVIESIGLSNDAGVKHILVPDVNGQRLALERAYRNSSPEIDYLECHATGTPVGDQIELATVEAFFDYAKKRPLLGANKANNGHMLTASGMGSLLKVILSMQHDLIPATLGVQQLVATPAGQLGLEHVVRSTQPWPANGRPKRAGINAFGFGGVNAHMVISEDHPRLRATQSESWSPLVIAPLALVGIGVHLAQTEDTDTLDQAVQQGIQHLYTLPPTRWMGIEQRADVLAMRGVEQPPLGSYIEKFEFDCKRFKLPPNVVGPYLLSHLFLLPVAERAFIDAGYALDGSKRNIAVIVAGGVDYGCLRNQARNEISWQLAQSLCSHGIELPDTDVQALQTILKDSLCPTPYPEGITGGIGNVVASRLAAHLHLNGPVFSLYSEESAPFKAFELAQFMLARQQVDAVIVASCSFAGGVENVLWDHQSCQANQAVGDGGGVVVLRREQDALRETIPIYAVVEGLAIGHAADHQLAFSADEEEMVTAMTQGLAAAGCTEEQIDYLEIYAGGRPDEIATELAALGRVYASPQRQAPLTLGTLKAHYGHLSAANGLLGIIKAALQLTQRYLPALPDYAQSTQLTYSAGDNFSLPRQTQFWPQPAQGLRRAAINHVGIDRAYSHMILRESQDGPRARPAKATVPAAGEFKVTVYTAREKMLADFIINEANLAYFSGAVNVATNLDTQVTPAATTLKYLVRNAQTQLQYLRLEQSYYQLLNHILSEHSSAAASAPLFDESQIIELTDGLVANVLGAEYAKVDCYPVRTRMPSPPYLFVSRITALSAVKDRLEPCYIEWEYDIPVDAWYVVDGKAPAFIVVESSHALIVAFTVIGCDHLFKGLLGYRAVDSQTTVYSEMPKAGEVLRGRVDINSCVRAGGMVLIAYEYHCYVGERLVLKQVGNSGFFTMREIAKVRQIDTAPYFAAAKLAQPFTPPLRCLRQRFDEQHISALMQGDIAACFGPQYAHEGAVKFSAPHSRMLSRVLNVDLSGGAFGLGEVIGEVDIDPGHWVFKVHFKNDPVMPGTLLVEGCEQLVKFYLYYLGLNSQSDLVSHTLYNLQCSAKFRSEVKCERDVLRYRLTCKSIDAQYQGDSTTLTAISLIFIAEIIYRGNVIGLCDNLGTGFTRRLPLPSTASAALLTQGA